MGSPEPCVDLARAGPQGRVRGVPPALAAAPALWPEISHVVSQRSGVSPGEVKRDWIAGKLDVFSKCFVRRTLSDRGHAAGRGQPNRGAQALSPSGGKVGV